MENTLCFQIAADAGRKKIRREYVFKADRYENSV